PPVQAFSQPQQTEIQQPVVYKSNYVKKFYLFCRQLLGLFCPPPYSTIAHLPSFAFIMPAVKGFPYL
ncbi:hypothetical protein, partial [Neisseria shayeganii]|uniref:hypothetical protein n=1 Tax=Neisseria shayeganii TaxID=607712 RepID=UPI001E420075